MWATDKFKDVLLLRRRTVTKFTMRGDWGGRKSWILKKMGPRASKIDFEGINLRVFDPKITFSTSIRVRNLTFPWLLKVFGNQIFQKITKTQKCSRNGSPWLENQHLRDQNASFFRAGAHGGRRFGQNHRFWSVFDDFGRRGSKISISGMKMHHFFVPELMEAAVLVQSRVLD